MSVKQQKAKLASIKQSIQSLQKNITLSQAQKEKILLQLEATEQNIGETAKKLQHTKTNLKAQQAMLHKTKLQHGYYQQVLAQQEDLLQQHIRAAYMLGRQQYFKMILNRENMAQVGRDIHYYHYLTQARLQIIQQIQSTLANLSHTTTQILVQTKRMQSIAVDEQHENNKLLQDKYARHQLLNTISASIDSKQQQLQKLLQDKASLENVLQNLQKSSVFTAAPGGNFARVAGQLPWPVTRARILQTFNQSIADGHLHSTGILIAGVSGAPVRAVYAGKVVFAHWLRGFGLLAIVQHGPSYMTLYGHAESLYVKPGDKVNAGDVIATIGDSGGLQQSALYFEIRHQDQPLNPLAWLRK